MENPIGFTFAPQPTSFNRQVSSPHGRLQQHAMTPQSPRGRSSVEEDTIISVLTPLGKRKRTPEDIDMEASSQSDVQPPKMQFSSPTPNKKIRSLPLGRPLPLSRLLDDLDKEGLQELLKNLCERHPGLTNEVYKHAPKPSVSKALSTLAVLERRVQSSFPFGGETKGEYAYNRVLPHVKELLNALMDYVPHFLPPNEEHALETLAFLDGATTIISRLPDWNNPNHSLTKREAFEEINGAWILGIREASKKGAGVAAAPYLDQLRHRNDESGGQLASAVNFAMRELSWVESSQLQQTNATSLFPRPSPVYGLFSR